MPPTCDAESSREGRTVAARLRSKQTPWEKAKELADWVQGESSSEAGGFDEATGQGCRTCIVGPTPRHEGYCVVCRYWNGAAASPWNLWWPKPKDERVGVQPD